MQIEFLKSKIHQATVTEVRADYEGSITIDSQLMASVGFQEHEKVLVANFRNGERFETYVIPGAPGSGKICVNGAATKLAGVGDQIIIMSFCLLTPEEARKHHPKVVRLDKANRILSAQPSHVA